MNDTEKIILDDKTDVMDLNNEPEELLDVDIKEDNNKKQKPKKPRIRWRDLPKKKKIMIIAILSVVLLIVVAVVLFLVLKKPAKTPSVIVQKDNYRYENGTLVFLNDQGKDIGTYECTNKNQDKCYVANYSGDEDLDVKKIIYEDGTIFLERSEIFANNFVFVTDGEKTINLYNINTKSIDGKYDEIKKFKDTMVIVAKDGKYGLVEISDDKISTKIDLNYDYLGYYGYDDNLIYKNKSNYGIMASDETVKASKIPNMIKSYNDKFIVTSDYKIYDYSSRLTKSPSADFISLDKDYVFIIKDNKLFIYDTSFNQINKDGISLTDDNYVETTIVDKTGKIIESKSAFKVETHESSIIITVDENEIEINPIEAKINNTISYVSYNDGYLYFYADKEKETEIGKYKCSNPNHVSASNTTYEECFVAKGTKLYDREVSDDLGYIPIYNNRYVFISDQSSVSENKNIIFYDLKDNKTLSTYLKVDAGYNNAKGEIEQATANDIIVFAFKPNSSYIVFKLNASGANPIIRNDKNASSVKYLGNNILAKYSDGTYHLFDIKGNEITKNLSDLKSEIVKYQSPNLLVKNNNKYQIYNADSGKVVSDEFDYIDLQSMYYVGIINKSMNLYNYSSKEKLLCQEISLDGVDSYDGIYSIKYNNPLNIEITVNLNPKRYYSFGGVEEFTINGEIVSCGDN